MNLVLTSFAKWTVPFDDDDKKQLARMIVQCDPSLDEEEWENVSEEAKDLIRKMLSKDPATRPTALQVLRHPWFAMDASELRMKEGLPNTLLQLRHFNTIYKERTSMFPIGGRSRESFRDSSFLFWQDSLFSSISSFPVRGESFSREPTQRKTQIE